MSRDRIALFLALLAAVAPAAGCATTASSYQDSWYDHGEHELVSTLGKPDGVRQIDARHKILTYHTFSRISMPSGNASTQPNYVGNTVFYPQDYGLTPEQKKGAHCTNEFTISDGKVTGWKWEGKGCGPE